MKLLFPEMCKDVGKLTGFIFECPGCKIRVQFKFGSKCVSAVRVVYAVCLCVLYTCVCSVSVCSVFALCLLCVCSVFALCVGV